MFLNPGKIVVHKELKRLAAIKRSDGEILRVSLEQLTDSDDEKFHFVCLRPWHMVGPDTHRPSAYAITVRADELHILRDALTAAIDAIPAHETIAEADSHEDT